MGSMPIEYIIINLIIHTESKFKVNIKLYFSFGGQRKASKRIPTADKILSFENNYRFIQRLETRFAQTFRLKPYSAIIIFNNLWLPLKFYNAENKSYKLLLLLVNINFIRDGLYNEVRHLEK